MNKVSEERVVRICFLCGGKKDEFGNICEEIMRRFPDLASLYRLVAQPKKRLSPFEFRRRVAEIARHKISRQHAGNICLICSSQFYHGVCPSCGLPIADNSSWEIVHRYLG